MYIQVYIFTYATLFYPITIRLVWENISNYSNLEKRILQARRTLRTRLRFEI